jgi:uncharacterized cupredoxin-like copper-binding protein
VRRVLLLVVSCALVGLVGCADESGGAAPGGVDVRVVEMTMREMSFDPAHVTVKAGETVTFRITNEGTVRHEAVFGTQAMQDAALAKMAQMDAGTTLPTAGGRSKSVAALPAHPGMGLPNVISLEAGRTGDITFRFDEPAEWLIQCHEKGHLEAGMAGTLSIVAA